MERGRESRRVMQLLAYTHQYQHSMHRRFECILFTFCHLAEVGKAQKRWKERYTKVKEKIICVSLRMFLA